MRFDFREFITCIIAGGISLYFAGCMALQVFGH